MRIRCGYSAWLKAMALVSVVIISSCGIDKKINETLNPATPETFPVAVVDNPDRTVQIHSTVTLDGSASHDPQQETLTYAWSLDEKPNGSSATLSGETNPITTFVADKGGYYTASLQVTNTSTKPSEIVKANISVVGTGSNHPPVAVAGADQTVSTGDVVLLDGTASFDADNDAISFIWTLLGKPSGSSATFDGTGNASSVLHPDVKGTYTVQLWVSDGVDGDLDLVVVKAE